MSPLLDLSHGLERQLSTGCVRQDIADCAQRCAVASGAGIGNFGNVQVRVLVQQVGRSNRLRCRGSMMVARRILALYSRN